MSRLVVKFEKEEIDFLNEVHDLLLAEEEMDYIRDVVADIDQGNAREIVIKLVEAGKITW